MGLLDRLRPVLLSPVGKKRGPRQRKRSATFLLHIVVNSLIDLFSFEADLCFLTLQDFRTREIKGGMSKMIA
jgi:hypothetical protein